MKVTVKSVVKYFAMLILAGVLLYFAFKGLKWKDFIEGLKSCNFWWILASMGTGVIAIILRGFRWRLMMLPLNKSITNRESYDAYAICYLSNLALPRSGELVRCGIIAKTGKATFEGVLGTVVLERSWDLFVSCIIIFAMVFFTRFGTFLVDKMWTPLMKNLHFNGVWLVVLLVALIFLIYYILKKNKEKVEKTKFGSKVIKFWRGLVCGVKAGFKMEKKGYFFIYTILIWGCYWMTSFFTINAFPSVQGLDLMDALFLMIVGSFGWLIPVQGGFGAYHFIVSMTLLPVYGIAQTTGVIFATISHESQIVIMIICGLMSLLSFSLYNKKNLKQSVK